MQRDAAVPRRGLGDATVQALQHHARRNSVPLLQAARLLAETEELKAKPRAALRDQEDIFFSDSFLFEKRIERGTNVFVFLLFLRWGKRFRAWRRGKKAGVRGAGSAPGRARQRPRHGVGIRGTVDILIGLKRLAEKAAVDATLRCANTIFAEEVR